MYIWDTTEVRRIVFTFNLMIYGVGFQLKGGFADNNKTKVLLDTFKWTLEAEMN